MVAEGDIVCHHQSIQVLDVQYRCINNSKPTNQKIEGIVEEIVGEIVEISTPSSSSSVYQQIRTSVSIPTEISCPEVVRRTSGLNSDGSLGSPVIQFMPTIRSGSYSDIGLRRFMEDEHIMIDDLSSHFDSVFKFPTPSAFYGVFDGHGGAEAAAYMKENAVRLFFENADTPQTYVSDDDDNLVEEVVKSFRKAFLLADNALADDCNVSSSSGTTAITALVLGRRLLVANVGDCRAVLCRKGKAIDMSQDHKPIHPPERRRIEQLGGYVDDGYLNGVLSVTRALGDWDMKFPRGSPSPLIAEPEFRQAILTKDDEFLIIGCDGLWDVMTSQEAVSFVRRGLRRHDDPHQCARDLIKESLRLNTGDNLTVIVICFLDSREMFPSPPRQRKGRWCFSAEALFTLRRHMDADESN